MKPQSFQVRQKEREEHRIAEQADQSQKLGEGQFATAEELMQHDSEQNPIPSSVAERLNNSIAAEKKPERSWFKKLWG